MIPIAKPYLTKDEAQAAYDTILTGWITQGPRVVEFEEKFAAYTGAKFAVATSNCTTALHLSMIVAGIGPGDEVICPSMSYIATPNSITYVGAVPVFAEIIPETYNLDPVDTEKKITDKIKRVSFLEQAVGKDISSNRFIPYIQLHEFEGLLFSDTKGFDSLPDIPESNIKQLTDAVKEHDNPEMLNDGPETSPSKRLEKLIPGYRKALYGPMIANEISVAVIMKRCVRFKNWIEALTQKMQQG